MNCVWCERPIRPRQDVRSLEEPNLAFPAGHPNSMVGVVHVKCLGVFRALMHEASTPQMASEEMSDRLDFLESQCNHGPWKGVWNPADGRTTPRCVKCGAPADHQLEPEDMVE